MASATTAWSWHRSADDEDKDNEAGDEKDLASFEALLASTVALDPPVPIPSRKPTSISSWRTTASISEAAVDSCCWPSIFSFTLRR